MGYKQKLRLMPDSIGHWLTGYLYAKGIIHPTDEQALEAIEALGRYRSAFAGTGKKN